MSSNHSAHDDHGAHGVELPHVSLRDYAIGFVLSVVLTALPFALVMMGPHNGFLGGKVATAIALVGLAATQIVVHMVFFLHMNGKVEGGWSLLALIFTVILVAIVLSGSSWVMAHLNANMMPMRPDQLP